MNNYGLGNVWDKKCRIMVIGTGGGGINALNYMMDRKLKGVEFAAVNTDIASVEWSRAPVKMQIGKKLTEGLGTGANPAIGKKAALENRNALKDLLTGNHMVVITAGLGGGTGTGAAPLIAKIARKTGALTVGVVTLPFSFEGKKRCGQAEEGLIELSESTDAVIIIPNDHIRCLSSENSKLIELFKKSDEMQYYTVRCMTDLIMVVGLVSFDLADVKTVLQNAGLCSMGTGSACGDNRAVRAAEKALSHPLLGNIITAKDARVLASITATSDMTLDEMTEVSDRIYEEINDEGSEFMWGDPKDESMGDEVRVTIIATGLKDERI